MNTESWCTVEKTASQDWKRSQRSHYSNSFQSSVFSQQPGGANGMSRLDFETDQVNIPHKHKRHFSEQHSLCSLKGASFINEL